MNDITDTRFVDPGTFKDFAGEDAIAVLVVKRNGEHALVLPEGAELESTPSPGTIQSLQTTTCYFKCVNGILFWCCEPMGCVAVGRC